MNEKLIMLYQKQMRVQSLIDSAIGNGATILVERLDIQLDNIKQAIDMENRNIYAYDMMQSN